MFLKKMVGCYKKVCLTKTVLKHDDNQMNVKTDSAQPLIDLFEWYDITPLSY